jgi:hypothetical protein
MTIKVIGDSNFRDLFTYHRNEIETEAETTVEFVMANSVASIKTVLEGSGETSEVIFIANPVNEISMKSKNNTKSREGIIESVVTDLLNLIQTHSSKQESNIFVICQPFLRLDPPWIEAKMCHYLEYLKSTLNSMNFGNTHLGSAIEIEAGDLKPDKVHLNRDGLAKLKSTMIADIKTAKSELQILRGASEEDEDMENVETTPVNETRALRNTPARKKRPLDNSPEDGKNKKKKSKDRIDAVLDKLDIMIDKMNGDRVSNNARFDKIDERLVATVREQEHLKKELKMVKKSENTFSASIREDLDAVENTNSRDTVIMKRVSTNENIPTEKKELTNFIVKTGKEILTLVLGSPDGMKFISPLYTNNNRRGPRKEGEVEKKELPPFKITFKHVADSINFKEKCIAASKDPGHRLYKAYVANQQSIGTRIRLSLLWGIADILKKDGKESWVSQSHPKPSLMVKETGNLIKTYGYIEAVLNYGEKIEDKTKEEATKLAKRFFYGQVERIFIILKD